MQAVQYEDAQERDEKAKSGIFVMVNGKAVKHEVEAGIADDTYVAISKGVKTGEQIITGPSKVLRFLHDGDRVSVVAADADASGDKPGVKGKDSKAPAKTP